MCNRIYTHNIIHKRIKIRDVEDEYKNEIIDQANININGCLLDKF